MPTGNFESEADFSTSTDLTASSYWVSFSQGVQGTNINSTWSFSNPGYVTFVNKPVIRYSWTQSFLYGGQMTMGTIRLRGSSCFQVATRWDGSFAPGSYNRDIFSGIQVSIGNCGLPAVAVFGATAASVVSTLASPESLVNNVNYDFVVADDGLEVMVAYRRSNGPGIGYAWRVTYAMVPAPLSGGYMAWYNSGSTVPGQNSTVDVKSITNYGLWKGLDIYNGYNCPNGTSSTYFGISLASCEDYAEGYGTSSGGYVYDANNQRCYTKDANYPNHLVAAANVICATRAQYGTALIGAYCNGLDAPGSPTTGLGSYAACGKFCRLLSGPQLTNFGYLTTSDTCWCKNSTGYFISTSRDISCTQSYHEPVPYINTNFQNGCNGLGDKCAPAINTAVNPGTAMYCLVGLPTPYLSDGSAIAHFFFGQIGSYAGNAGPTQVTMFGYANPGGSITRTWGVRGYATALNNAYYYPHLGPPIKAGLNTTSFTIAVWMRLDAAPSASGSPICYRNPSTSADGGWCMFIDATTLMPFLSVVDSTHNMGSTGTGPVLSVGTWYHLAASCNGTVLSLYVNGVLANSSSINGYTPPNVGNFTVNLTPRAVTSLTFSIDEVFFYDYAANDTTIADWHTAAACPPGFYYNCSSCMPCATTCGAGEFLVAQCNGMGFDPHPVCVGCSSACSATVTNACTDTTAYSCIACAPGYGLSLNGSYPCAPCPAGQTLNTTANPYRCILVSTTPTPTVSASSSQSPTVTASSSLTSSVTPSSSSSASATATVTVSPSATQSVVVMSSVPPGLTSNSPTISVTSSVSTSTSLSASTSATTSSSASISATPTVTPLVCAVGCTTCVTNSYCTLCADPNATPLAGICTCKVGFYGSGATCGACNVACDNTTTCTGPSDAACTKCAEIAGYGWNIDHSRCIEPCPAGQIMDTTGGPGTNQCQIFAVVARCVEDPCYTYENPSVHNATVTVTLSRQPLAHVLISLTSSNPSKGLVLETLVDLDPTTWNTGVNVTVYGSDIRTISGVVPYTLSLAASSTDSRFNLAASALTVLSYDSAGTSVFQAGGATTTTYNGGGAIQLYVAMTAQPQAGSDVVANVASTNLREASVAPATLTFTSTNFRVPQLVTVTPAINNIAEGNITYAVTVGSSGLSSTSVTLLNINMMTAGLAVTLPAGGVATNELGVPQTVSIALTSQPLVAVLVSVAVVPAQQAALSSTAPLLFTPATWNTPQSVVVTGNRLSQPHGNATFALQLTSDAAPPAGSTAAVQYGAATWQTPQGTNTRIYFPEISSVSPLLSALLGGWNLTAVGGVFATGLRIDVIQGNASSPVLNLIVATVGSTAVATFTTPAMPATGYVVLRFSNWDGGSTDFAGLYYTDDCPYVGMFGRGSDCVSCPKGGSCPGGYRIWPLPGYWNSGEQSGFVSQCPDPPSRCAGGVLSSCAEGYQGPLCGACAPGYFQQGSVCTPCGNTGILVTLLIVDGIFFGLLTFAMVVLPDKRLRVVVVLVMLLQGIRAVGQVASSRMPPFLGTVYYYLSLVAIDVSFLRAECTGLGTGYSVIFWANLILIAMLVLPLVIVLGVLSLIHKPKRAQYVNRLIRGLTVYAHMLYLVICTRVFQAVNCVNVNGERRLQIDPQLPCSSGSPVLAVGWALATLVVVLYPMSMLGALAYLAKHKRLDSPVVIARLGYIYDGFRHSRVLFAGATYLQLMMLALAAAFQTSDDGSLDTASLQFLLCGGAYVCQLVFQILFRPYQDPADGILALVAAAAGLCAATLNYLSSYRIGLPAQSVFAVALGMCFTVLFLTAIALGVLWRRGLLPPTVYRVFKRRGPNKNAIYPSSEPSETPKTTVSVAEDSNSIPLTDVDGSTAPSSSAKHGPDGTDTVPDAKSLLLDTDAKKGESRHSTPRSTRPSSSPSRQRAPSPVPSSPSAVPRQPSPRATATVMELPEDEPTSPITPTQPMPKEGSGRNVRTGLRNNRVSPLNDPVAAPKRRARTVDHGRSEPSMLTESVLSTSGSLIPGMARRSRSRTTVMPKTMSGTALTESVAE